MLRSGAAKAHKCIYADRMNGPDLGLHWRYTQYTWNDRFFPMDFKLFFPSYGLFPLLRLGRIGDDARRFLFAGFLTQPIAIE